MPENPLNHRRSGLDNTGGGLWGRAIPGRVQEMLMIRGDGPGGDATTTKRRF